MSFCERAAQKKAITDSFIMAFSWLSKLQLRAEGSLFIIIIAIQLENADEAPQEQKFSFLLLFFHFHKCSLGQYFGLIWHTMGSRYIGGKGEDKKRKMGQLFISVNLSTLVAWSRFHHASRCI